jgi:hypothetical protein
MESIPQITTAIFRRCIALHSTETDDESNNMPTNRTRATIQRAERLLEDGSQSRPNLTRARLQRLAQWAQLLFVEVESLFPFSDKVQGH